MFLVFYQLLVFFFLGGVLFIERSESSNFRNRRPVHLVFNWYARYDFTAHPRAALLASQRGAASSNTPGNAL